MTLCLSGWKIHSDKFLACISLIEMKSQTGCTQEKMWESFSTSSAELTFFDETKFVYSDTWCHFCWCPVQSQEPDLNPVCPFQLRTLYDSVILFYSFLVQQRAFPCLMMPIHRFPTDWVAWWSQLECIECRGQNSISVLGNTVTVTCAGLPFLSRLSQDMFLSFPCPHHCHVSHRCSWSRTIPAYRISISLPGTPDSLQYESCFRVTPFPLLAVPTLCGVKYELKLLFVCLFSMQNSTDEQSILWETFAQENLIFFRILQA